VCVQYKSEVTIGGKEKRERERERESEREREMG